MENEMDEIYGKDHYLIRDDGLYNVHMYSPNETFNDSTAYLIGEYYYLYKGEISQYQLDRSPGLRPGIYMNSDTEKPFVVEVSTDTEKETYLAKPHIKRLDPSHIIDSINNHDTELVGMPKAALHDLYQILPKDGILKRAAKTIFNEKGLSIDDCEDGFEKKNTRFNFKQAMNSDKPLSWTLLNRATDATRTKITLLIEDKDPNNVIGQPLTEPIRLSTEDSYEL